MASPLLPLPQLHAFVVLAEELHFGHAAARLGIAQPPLSQQIRRLEDKVGHPLFTRTPGPVALTPAGRELLPAARRALTGLADGLAAARAAADGRTGRLRIGFAASLALTVLPGLLRTHRDRHPGVHLDIREMTTGPQLAALRDGTLDVGLLREPPEHDEDLSFRTILEEPFVAVLPTSHPLAARHRTLPPAALADSPFVLLPREAGPGLHDRINRPVHRRRIHPARHPARRRMANGLRPRGNRPRRLPGPRRHPPHPPQGHHLPPPPRDHPPHHGLDRLALLRRKPSGEKPAGHGRRLTGTGHVRPDG
ncbi:DNA-binding transcriptional LysR family regulator [Streptomyces glaucescens]